MVKIFNFIAVLVSLMDVFLILSLESIKFLEKDLPTRLILESIVHFKFNENDVCACPYPISCSALIIYDFRTERFISRISNYFFFANLHLSFSFFRLGRLVDLSLDYMIALCWKIEHTFLCSIILILHLKELSAEQVRKVYSLLAPLQHHANVAQIDEATNYYNGCVMSALFVLGQKKIESYSNA